MLAAGNTLPYARHPVFLFDIGGVECSPRQFDEAPQLGTRQPAGIFLTFAGGDDPHIVAPDFELDIIHPDCRPRHASISESPPPHPAHGRAAIKAKRGNKYRNIKDNHAFTIGSDL